MMIIPLASQREFEDVLAKGCDDWRQHSDECTHSQCGTGYCRAWESHKCKSIPTIRKWLADSNLVGVVFFRNEDLWSSHVGEGQCMKIGPDCTYHVIEDVEGKHLNDQPSQRQYPVMWCKTTSELQREGAVSERSEGEASTGV